MKEFYPVSKQSEALLNDINEDANRSFYCLDPTDQLEIYGEHKVDHSYLEFFLLPCNVLFTERGYIGDTISEECTDWDLQKQ